jgi:hypothetical protein
VVEAVEAVLALPQVLERERCAGVVAAAIAS